MRKGWRDAVVPPRLVRDTRRPRRRSSGPASRAVGVGGIRTAAAVLPRPLAATTSGDQPVLAARDSARSGTETPRAKGVTTPAALRTPDRSQQELDTGGAGCRITYRGVGRGGSRKGTTPSRMHEAPRCRHRLHVPIRRPRPRPRGAPSGMGSCSTHTLRRRSGLAGYGRAWQDAVG